MAERAAQWFHVSYTLTHPSITAEYQKIVCTNDETSDRIRGIVRHMLDKDIHLEELEFRPSSPSVHEWGLRNRFDRKRPTTKAVTV